ncbi:hypothetical protein HUA76_20560 [Myxococcus sp. CA056]|uniref:hypothetical protein n=1 Tax=Myxococcus sp. CA056 TaxID=2741740 RepID=UPI00157A2D3F|nr:hypothetical protein [Myxococcus sp. CA056]NTX13199.1 hypothetical protein [Myxococcus sp. CA056]
MRHGLLEARAVAEVAALPGQGLHVENLVADPTHNPPRFAFTANNASGCVPHVYVDGAMSQYPTLHGKESAQGYRMKKPQVYNNGASFTAVFDKSGTCP